MARKEIIETIITNMNDYCEGIGYRLNTPGELPYDEKWNKIQFVLRLSGGDFVINLMGKGNVFKYLFDDNYPQGKTSADYEEIIRASKFFDSKIDVVKMAELFSKL